MKPGGWMESPLIGARRLLAPTAGFQVLLQRQGGVIAYFVAERVRAAVLGAI